MTQTILEQIKEQTKEKHLSLEKNKKLSLLTDVNLEIGQYIDILKKFYGFFAPLEEKINQFSSIHNFIPDLKDRRKATALLTDIFYLSKNEQKEPQIADFKELPDVSTVAEAFGCLYVLEGSTLGGRFIYKNLENTLGLNSEQGASFFYGYGNNTGVKWKIFQSGLSNYMVQNPEQSAFAIHAAVITFEKLELWFDKNE